MAKKQSKLLTLSEVSKRAAISMPTLQRYKRDYQDRIPSEGEGRKQRYPTEALKVFREIKKENLKRRGRPPKSADASSAATPSKAAAKGTRKRRAKKTTATRGRAAAKAKSQAAPEPGSLLSLLQISKMTGIEYTKLQRLTKKYLEDIPMEGAGRARKYYAEAVEIYKRLEAEGASRVRKAASGVRKTTKRAKRRVKRGAKVQVQAVVSDEAALQMSVAALEQANKDLRKEMVALQRDMRNLVKNLKKTIRIKVLK